MVETLSVSISESENKSTFGESDPESYIGLIIILFLVIAGLMFYFRSPSKKNSLFGRRK